MSGYLVEPPRPGKRRGERAKFPFPRRFWRAGGDREMAALFFVSQAALDAWAESGKIELDGPVMTLSGRGGSGAGYALEPALRFLQVVGADHDPHALVGKVKPEARLRELGGEQLAGSVVLGDVGYEVEVGFLCDAGVAAGGRPAGGVSPTPDAAGELTRFVLQESFATPDR
jgi:hypothetical protein